MLRLILPALAFVAIVSALPSLAFAGDLVYALEFPDGRSAKFAIEFQVTKPGPLAVRASWEGSRVVSFRLEGPGAPPLKVRRSGPSPQVLEFEVDEKTVSWGRTWKLAIRTLPVRGKAKGKLVIRVPEGREPEPARPEPAASPTPPPVETWRHPRPAPAGATDDLVRFFDAVEAFRSAVVVPDRAAVEDRCGWQVETLRYVTSWRDRITAGEAVPDEATRRFLERLSLAVTSVEEIRTSDDPLIAGPVPETRLRQRAWHAVREDRLLPIEIELDSLTESIRKRLVPDLASRTWPSRFLACLTSCERHFDEVVHRGDEAANGEIAAVQWDRILEAGRALGQLAALR